jgi:hypothetical protein
MIAHAGRAKGAIVNAREMMARARAANVVIAAASARVAKIVARITRMFAVHAILGMKIADVAGIAVTAK